MPYSKPSQDTCSVRQFESRSTMEGTVPTLALSLKTFSENDNWDRVHQLYRNTAWLLSQMGSAVPWASRPGSRRQLTPACLPPAHLTHPTESALLPQDLPVPSPGSSAAAGFLLLFVVYTIAIWDLLIRFAKDSVKLKPLNSYKHQGVHHPKFGLSFRIGSSYFPLIILFSELKTCLQQRIALSTHIPA